MQIKPTKAIRALEGLKVMALSVRVGSGRVEGWSVRSRHHIRHIELLQGRRKSCMKYQTVSSLGFCILL